MLRQRIWLSSGPPLLLRRSTSGFRTRVLPHFSAAKSRNLENRCPGFPSATSCSVLNLKSASTSFTSIRAVTKDIPNSVDTSVPEGLVSVMEEIPVLSLSEVGNRLQSSSASKKSYRAMYSSVIGGITLDPAAMVVPIDDHMVHRGHAVFDTATIYNGHLYELDAHLDRLLRSAAKAKLTPPFERSELRNILVQTVAASGCTEGTLRYWLSAGPGGFSLSPKECERGAFYAVVIEEAPKSFPDGAKVSTSSVPIKPPEFATMKSTNYLPNALVVMEAEEKGAFMGIWLDQEGYVAEGANMNVAFVSKGELVLPPFANILTGCTAKRLMLLAQDLIVSTGSDDETSLKSIKQCRITVEEGKAADEMMLVVSSYLIVPVVEWDGQPVGTGKVGPITKALVSMMRQDVLEGPPEVLEVVPYK